MSANRWSITWLMRSLMDSSPPAVSAYMMSQSVALRGSSVGMPQSMRMALSTHQCCLSRSPMLR